jgi:putative FmdB family regulatory protein
MPLYEYECESCGKRFERIRRFSDPPIETCVACGGPVHKLMSSPAIQFKGSGWYVTDYARKGSSPASASGSSAEKASDTAKTDDAAPTKPAAPAGTSSSD